MSEQLASLFNKYKCDKASKHKYHTVYGPELEHLRDKPINILEVGVFKGASTSAWLEHFPQATIYCIDIFTRVHPKNIPVLTDPRVKWLAGDSTNPLVVAEIKQAWPRIKFDVIIDDGMHTPRANASTLQNLFGFLKNSGIYFVEDVWALEEMTSKELSHPWIQEHSKDINLLENQQFLNLLSDKNVTRFDLRKETKQPDSYIIKIVK